MALSKAQQAALESWKKGEGEMPEFLTTGHFFENDDHLGRVVQSKLAPEAKKVRDKLQAEMLDSLGVTDPEELATIKQKLAEAAGTLTEVEKLRGENAKLTKEAAKSGEKTKALEGFRTEVLKGRAVEPLLVKVAENLRPAARRLIEMDLAIDGDKVVGPEGVEVDKFVDEFLKGNPAFKAPETKSGAGTGPNGGKSKQQTSSDGGQGKGADGDGGSNGSQSNGNGANAPKLSLGATISNVLKEQAAQAASAGDDA